jgi:hypothetical protein
MKINLPLLTKNLFILFLIISKVYAQSLKEKMAEKHFNELSFFKSFEYYSELAAKKNANPTSIRRAAECCSYLNRPTDATAYYEKLIKTGATTNIDLYKYTQELKRIGAYVKAEEYLQKLTATNEFPIFTNRHKNSGNYYLDLKKDSTKYKIAQTTINTSENEFGPYVVKDNFYFTSNKTNLKALNNTFSWDESYFLDIYSCDYRNKTIQKIKTLNSNIDSKYHDGPASFSSDGNTIYITRSNYVNKKIGKDTKGFINLKIYFSKKDEQGKWGKLEDFPFNSDDYSVGHPAITNDGKTIFFISDMPGGYGLTDLYRTTLHDDVWGKPENLGPTINSEGKELFPYVNKQNVLFFSSDGNAGLGGLDIYYSLLDKDAYVTSTNMGYPVNTKADDFSIFIDDSDTTGFISSNRAGGMGKDDIYAVSFLKPIKIKKQLNGIIVDEKTDEPIPFAKVSIKDKNEKIITELETTDKGAFTTQLQKEDFFKISIKKDGYSDKLAELIYSIISDKENKFTLVKIDTVKKAIEEVVAKKSDTLKVDDSKKNTIAANAKNDEPKKQPDTQEYAEVKEENVAATETTKANTSIKNSESTTTVKNSKEEKLAETKTNPIVKNESSSITTSASEDRERLLKLYGRTSIPGLKYLVQVGAYRKPQNFNNQALSQQYSIKQNGVVLGNVTTIIIDKEFDTWNEAEEYLTRARELGQTDAFLVGLMGEKRIYLKEILANGIWENKSLQVATN